MNGRPTRPPPVTLIALLLPVFCGNTIARAEKMPLSAEQLRRQAEVIVVGAIRDLRVEAQPSRFEPGVGNSDWAIYPRIDVQSVEKGRVSSETLEARCFRIRSRFGFAPYLTASGHAPIPARGSRVRVYLKKHGKEWDVLLPNGITAFDAGGASVEPVHATLPPAPELRRLRGPVFSYLFPLENWLLLLLLLLAVVSLALFAIRCVMFGCPRQSNATHPSSTSN